MSTMSVKTLKWAALGLMVCTSTACTVTSETERNSFSWDAAYDDMYVASVRRGGSSGATYVKSY